MADEQRRSQAMYHIAFLQAGNGDALVKGFARCTNDYMPIQKAVLSALRAYTERGRDDEALRSQMILDAIKEGERQAGGPIPSYSSRGMIKPRE
jgi:hypothetical protein